MPIEKVGSKYRWGKHGKLYPSRAGAEKQMKAAFASGYKGKSDGGVIEEKEKTSKTPFKKPSRKEPKGK